MIFTTLPTDRRRKIRGFTLTEILISAGISAFIMVGILQTFLMIGRTGFNAANYCVMEAESRRAMETFSQEIRMARTVTWNSNTSITLTVPDASTTYTVTYAYDSSTSGATALCFYRMLGTAGSGNPRRILVRNVTSLAFQRYKLVTSGSNIASNDLETKQIQLTLQTTMKGQTTAAITNAVLSARYILRNKNVTA
ncbi:MAG: prepilin-type N-terminal cleavage/methylation domain-containing protein [Cephaloticoccus sp.]|nr:prepilin-type N-terminal cleavage/methylation domain-containing protein [Cephaloticoccus sp.]MCF7761759.1 prepilin-type N-terminal cleavage/methylation domain-containing protein [Cephaloticoccus sp.]